MRDQGYEMSIDRNITWAVPSSNFREHNAAESQRPEIYPAGRFLCFMEVKRLLLALIVWGSSFYILLKISLVDTYTRKARHCFMIEMLNHKEDLGFKDQIFEPLLTLYKQKAAGKLAPGKKNFRKGNIPRVLLWARPFWGTYWYEQTSHIRNKLCPLPCEVTFDVKEKNDVDAILIELRGANDPQRAIKALGPRNLDQPWIMLSLESPPLALPKRMFEVSRFNGFFNRTMMYRSDADIILPHGFVVSKEDAKLLPPAWVVPPVLEQGNQERKLAVAFISKNNELVHSDRLEYVKYFQKYAPIDIYGKYGTKKCGKSMIVHLGYNPLTDKCLKLAGEKYLFMFSFENNFCKDYITEKVYNFLHYPIVPVVRGLANYSSFLPPNSYINANEYSPKELAEKLLYLQQNPEEYQKYFAWKNHFQPSTIGGERTFCHLCARLYDPQMYEHRVIEDFEDWFVYKSECWSPIYTQDLRNAKRHK
ncbi:4-galactosyl-N-acetylglucosaminide 3-alpha-L-fucosyltransferase FUT6-like [Palaemon carinicauda]|uniref:4-galactosyl-N-acetylglucosaminide 3-alpha-L-fucosyltransferase FUT6-like n=1 Tax=Palaemon carinicauda TaxID=392227 RepID=UPI0035B65BAC